MVVSLGKKCSHEFTLRISKPCCETKNKQQTNTVSHISRGVLKISGTIAAWGSWAPLFHVAAKFSSSHEGRPRRAPELELGPVLHGRLAGRRLWEPAGSPLGPFHREWFSPLVRSGKRGGNRFSPGHSVLGLPAHAEEQWGTPGSKKRSRH